MKVLSSKLQQGLLLFAITLLIALAIFLFSRQLDNITSSSVSTETESAVMPSAYVKQAHVQSFNEDGSIEFEVHSPKLEQFSAENKMLLDSPIIDYKTQHHYQVSASTGILSNKRHLLLKDNAIIRRIDSSPQSMTSEYFNIDLQDKIVTSDKLVTIKSVGATTTANALHADIDQEQITLTNRVRGVYEP